MENILSMSDLSKIQFIFIIGAPRSGTTWLHAMIATHPGVVATPEVEQTFFSNYLAPIVKSWEAELYHIKRGAWVQGLPYLWTEEEFGSFVQYFFEKVYVKMLEKKPDAGIIIDKHPEYSHHVKLIKRFVPNAKFIHIVRDGRNTVVSMMSAAKRIGFGEKEIKGAASSWVRHIENARKASLCTDSCYLEVKYEDMVRDKKGILAKIVNFCGLEWSDNLVFDNKEYSSPNPDISSTERQNGFAWVSQLTVKQKYIFDQVAGKLLIDLGYEKNRSWVFRNKVEMFRFYLGNFIFSCFLRIRLTFRLLFHGRI